MHRTLVIAIGAACSLGAATACAQAQIQVIPSPLTREPAPIPAPSTPPAIDGPSGGLGTMGNQSPNLNNPNVPTVNQPPNLNTFSDRATTCLQTGGNFGLTGEALNSYTSSCINDTR